MNEVESFFNQVASKDRAMDSFFEDSMFLAVREWNMTPEEFTEMEIPLLYLMLKKQGEFNKERTKVSKR